MVGVALSCEVATKLTIKGVPPQFHLSGSGELGRLVVRGPDRQRDIRGPDASAYRYIEPKKGGGGPRNVGRLSPLTYGKVPEGYEQTYPGRGEATPLKEGEVYYVQVNTLNAPGASKYFVIKGGRVDFADYESELPGS